MGNFEDLFPGNTAALAKLKEYIAAEEIVAFTGAGCSMPVLPSWTTLIFTLIQEAEEESLISAENAETYRNEVGETLFVADQLASAFGSYQMKNRVCTIFEKLSEATEAHETIVGTSFTRFITLNYDLGIEMAYSKVRGRHLPSITPTQSNEITKWLSTQSADMEKAVLHWHGIVTHAEDVVLTGHDYSSFYDKKVENTQFLQKMFESERVLFVGFGFGDPFITRQLESVMRPLSSEAKHFALIGVPEGQDLNVSFERIKYRTKYKLETIFYPVKASADGLTNHEELLVILREIRAASPYNIGKQIDVSTKQSKLSYKSNLFSVGDRQIYCEPNIWTGRTNSESSEPSEIGCEKISSMTEHAYIAAPHEYGLTTAGYKIAADIRASGRHCIIRDAGSLPSYAKKLRKEAGLSSFEGKPFTLILDNFSSIEHERLLNELIGTFPAIRLIVLQRAREALGNVADEFESKGFRIFELYGLSRSNIREVVDAFLPAENEDKTSIVVDKIYSDLLKLCIPLTPANVIMYTNILCKDGDFSPVSRLHIVDRFVSSALKRASDVYVDSFDVNNKIDLVSRFCIKLFEEGRSTFRASDWFDFCEEYRKKTLSSFNPKETLNDLMDGRILLKLGEQFTFRYKMFFSYFVGRYVAAREEILNKFVQEDAHLSMDGLVEVLCGLAPDSSMIIESITGKLVEASNSFYSEYPINGLDLHRDVKWKVGAHEDAIWNKVAQKLEDGPALGNDIDRLKTSISAEKRTEDQRVEIVKFVAQESSVSSLGVSLRLALESAAQASASAKIGAAEAVAAGYRLAYEVALLLSPMIAKRKYVSWNGFAYINLIERPEREDDEDRNRDQEMFSAVVGALPRSIVHNASDNFGSRKLGEVFSEMASSRSCGDFSDFLLFGLVLRSKPDNWLSISTRMVRSSRKDELFLYHMLGTTLEQFRDEINTTNERNDLKKLIAEIRLKRETSVKAPNRTLIKEAVTKMETTGYLSLQNDDG